MSKTLQIALRKGLKAVAVKEDAGPMQAYMKSDMPFYGVKAPVQRKVFKEVFTAHPLLSQNDWRDAIELIWHEAEHREERYGVVSLIGAKPYRPFATTDLFDLYEDLVVTGAWWDLIDGLVISHFHPLIMTDPKETKKILCRWSKGDDIWMRRVAILSQLKSKKDMDLKFLEAVIKPSFGHEEFFIRKAIGWVLRDYCYTDWEWVYDYVKTHRGQLAPLTRREALRNALKKGLIPEIP